MSQSLDAKKRQNRIPIMFSNDELTSIDDWRFENRVASRAEAIRRLVCFALAHGSLAGFNAEIEEWNVVEIDGIKIAKGSGDVFADLGIERPS